MITPPTGTVTFLFTDVEGSTRRAAADAAAWAVAQARHHEIVEAAIEAEDGFVFRVVGDAFLAAFSEVGRAVVAAVSAQRGLQAERWPGAPVKIRIGLHTGAAEWRDGDYEGYLTLARTQRVMAIGYGGQVLLSQTAADLARNELPADLALRDLGDHLLKDLPQPEHLYQVAAADLPADFPPLRSIGAEPNNLPVQLTSFIGREGELTELQKLLGASRLITLTGPGGTGKTRLALQLATQVLETFAAGAWLVELAPVSDSGLVQQTVAATLGVREQPGRTILDALNDYVRSKSLLLVLDNCEHLIESCARLAEAVLRIAPGLRVVATSRESLGIAGETAFRVPSLSVPDERGGLDRLADNDCVRLFVDRASAADPRFRLTSRNAAAVAEICRRLDGIPLAIELAAARIRVFPADEIAARLDDRFRLLTGGSRTALERHQTLQALIDWSHELLTEPERVLLRRLSVFAGGWGLAAAEAVCGDGLGEAVLETIAHLVDKSMVVVEALADSAESRYRLLETIRQYARDKLLASGESGGIRDRHLDFFLRFAETAEPKLRGMEQLAWLDRVETDHDNLRAALAWALEGGESEHALRLAGALYWFWELRAHFNEGLKWLDDALALDASEPGLDVAAIDDASARGRLARRAKALYGVSRLQIDLGSPRDEVAGVAEETLRLWRSLDDDWWIAVALEATAVIALLGGDHRTALARLEEGVSIARHVEDRWPLALNQTRLASALMRTDVQTAVDALEESMPLAKSIGDQNLLAFAFLQLAATRFLAGDLEAARAELEESLTHARATGGSMYIDIGLLLMALIAGLRGDAATARNYAHELLALARDTGNLFASGMAVLAFGVVASAAGQANRAARLLGAVDSAARQRGIALTTDPGSIGGLVGRVVGLTRGQLEPAEFDAAFLEGAAMSLEQALELATRDERDPATVAQIMT